MTAAAFLSFLASAMAGGAKPPIVAVFEIEDRGAGLSEDARLRLVDYLSARLAATGAFSLVPREQIRARLREEKKQSYRLCYDQACQIELGRELAAEKALATKIIKLGDRCTVSCTLFDLKTATTSAGATATGGCDEDSLAASMDEAVGQLAGRQFPETGRRESVRSAPEFRSLLRVSSAPDKAVVMLDGLRLGFTPLQKRVRPEGPKQLELWKEGFRTFRRVIDTDGDQELSVSLVTVDEWNRRLSLATELVALRLVGGITPQRKSTAGAVLSVYSFKWRHFRLTCLEGGGGYAGSGNIAFGYVGARAGYPLYLGSSMQHQLEFGLGLGYGGMTIYNKPEDVSGFALWPSVSYTYKSPASDSQSISERLFYRIGFQVLLVPTGFDARVLDGGDAVIFMFGLEMGLVSLPEY